MGPIMNLLRPFQKLRAFNTTRIALCEATQKKLQELVRKSKVVIFMKGTPKDPKCGFSNAVVQIMRMHGVTYEAHDVLADEGVRQGIKEFSNWPTIPQVYIDGEFVGGCDILLQMHQTGELIKVLKKAQITSLQEKKE